MPFFTKAVAELSADDLQELLVQETVENIRLEFKREIPGPDELIKKVSGFANAFGGYVIVGAEASSSDGRLANLPGVEPQSSYRQTVIQRCNDSIWPAPIVSVSDPIQVTEGGRVCYVIQIPPSMLAPHFLTKRRGAYIRTDEFSHRFDAKLATFDEITQLAARRAVVHARREELFQRSENRFDHLVATQYAENPHTTGGIGATMSLSVMPQFPMRQVVGIPDLVRLLHNTRIGWRQVEFPMLGSAVTQHESVLVLQSAGGFSLLEATAWGTIYYAGELEGIAQHETQARPAIHLHSFLGHVLAYLEHAKGVLNRLPELGQLLIRVKLLRIRNVPFVSYPFGNMPHFGPASPLDDTVAFDVGTDRDRINTDRDAVATELLKLIFFALNWPDYATDDSCREALIDAAKYNFWET